MGAPAATVAAVLNTDEGKKAKEDLGNTINPVLDTVNDVGVKANKYANQLKDDPKRRNELLPTNGLSEWVKEGQRLGGELVKDNSPRPPEVGAAPGSGPPSPGGDSAPPAADAPAEPIKETQDEQRRSRGRASTILTGRRGLSGEAKTARRTLLGV